VKRICCYPNVPFCKINCLSFLALHCRRVSLSAEPSDRITGVQKEHRFTDSLYTSNVVLAGSKLMSSAMKMLLVHVKSTWKRIYVAC